MDSNSNLANNNNQKSFNNQDSLNNHDSFNNQKSFKDSDYGILLISHGSTLPYASEIFEEISNKYVKDSGHNTEIGYMKVAKPSISKAIDNLIAKNPNTKEIIAMPVFLAPGIHTNIDIPIMLNLDPLEIDPRCPDGNYPDDHYLNEMEAINFNGKINLIDCIGPDALILDMINQRVESAIERSNTNISPEKTAILLISHGSRLKYNKEFITDVFNQYKANNSYITGQGFMELCEPTIPQSINKLSRENDFDRLIVVPVFIAPGVHTMRDIPTILGLIDPDESNNHNHSHSHSHNHSHDHHRHHDDEELEFDGEILYTEPLGADDLLVQIIKERVQKEIK